MLTSVKGIYENGSITLLEPAPGAETSEVIITFLENKQQEIVVPRRIRKPGGLKELGLKEGKKYSLPDDFNEPLDELKEYM